MYIYNKYAFFWKVHLLFDLPSYNGTGGLVAIEIVVVLPVTSGECQDST
jgi:hypothetical protein